MRAWHSIGDQKQKDLGGCFVPHGPVDTGAAFVNNLLRHNGGGPGRGPGGRSLPPGMETRKPR